MVQGTRARIGKSKGGERVRNAGKLKAGYYPLPLAEAERIRQWLEFPSTATVALDPCVGEGTAFAVVAADQAVLRCGIELDAYRAEKALAVCGHVIQGDALETVCPSESVSLLYENPPYDWELGDTGNRRMEAIFLEHTYRWLKPGGVLVFVVPVQRLADCKHVLAPHFRDIAVARLTEPECLHYKQVVLFGVRRSRRERERLSDSEISRTGSYLSCLGFRANELSSLRDAQSKYPVPPADPVHLSYRGLPLDQLEDLLPRSAAYRQARPVLFAPNDEIEERPLIPLHGGQIGLLATSGMLDGVFGEGADRHIAVWQSVKVIDRTEEEEDGTLTIRERERFSNVLTIAYEAGRVAVLK